MTSPATSRVVPLFPATVSMRPVEQEARSSSEELMNQAKLMAHVAMAVARSRDLPSLLQQCASAISAHFEHTVVQIWVLDEATNTLKLTASAGIDPSFVTASGLVPLGPQRAASPRSNGADNHRNGDGSKPTSFEPQVRFVGEPLLANGRLVGALALFSPEPFSAASRKILKVVAECLVVGIDRHAMVSALQEMEEQFRTIIEFTLDAMVIVDHTGKIVLVNSSAERLFGYERSELLGQPIEILVPERMRDAHVGLRNQYLESPRRRAMQGSDNLVARRKDGRECPVEVSLSPIRTARFSLVVASVRDVSVRQQVEAERTRLLDAMNQQRAELQMILDAVPALIFYKDRQSRLVRVNAAHSQFFGLPREQIEGKTDAELGSPFAEQYVRDDQRVMTTGEPLRDIVEQFQTPTGIRWLRTDKVPYRDAQGNIVGLVGIATDITEQKQLEDQLRQAQRLESIGLLAGGVAHDFNNLLTVINGYSELLLQDMDENHPQRPLLTEIKSAGERAASVTHQLLAFSRKQVLQPRQVILNEQVASLTKMLRRLIGEHIHLQTQLSPDLWPVLADVGQLEQVIMNLAINARDAMPHGGELRIDTRNVTVTERDVAHPRELMPGQYVLLSVTDNGCGMDEATQARVFDPFFTTKGEGKGTGLGLAVVYGIVKQSGGHIDVRSAVGQGTTFSIYLPRLQNGVDESVYSRPNSAEIPRGTETILLVEDEECVRRLTRQTLQSCGYQVLEAADGNEALQISAAHAGPIHLMITDVIMPHLGGRQLAAQLLSQRPTLKVLYVSGYTADTLTADDLGGVGTAFLQKPFNAVMLTQKVRSVLDQRRAAPPAADEFA